MRRAAINDDNIPRREKMKKKTVFIFSAVCALAVVAMILALVLTGGTAEQEEFVPPEFDSAAQSGVPEAADKSWTQIYRDGMNFSAHICGKVVIKDGSADLFFSSDSSNNVWLRLRILDESGNILAETGLLKPGEYLKTVEFISPPPSGTKIKLKIMAYEPQTYYSAGAVTLNTTAE